ncbi:MAG: 50S ribosome-binding GTPase [candidate division Zixibacteria bacterium]|nr:50S ribosome-binding GTPase [candidate division Zixibacteria bacterium]
MPANLPPQYYELEREFRAETDSREKLRLAQELLRTMPKHKGTTHLQADMKTKIANLKRDIESGGSSHGARQTVARDYIEKEGAGQAILIGPPNSGKSSLVDSLTGAKPLVADYPYSTREPLPGMMTFETVQFQLIDTPPISPETFENYLAGLIRNADLVVLVCDLEANTMLDDLKFIVSLLKEKRIVFCPEIPEESDDARLCCKKTILCAHKSYEDESGAKRERLACQFPGLPMVSTSIIDDDSLDTFRRTIFKAFNIMRIYTKPVGKDADFKDPVILPEGGTVEDAARGLHKDFAAKLKFAKVWGEGKFDGQKVQSDFQLADTDIVEFHI